MIRPATTDDLPRLMELANLMHAESRFQAIALVPAKLEATLRLCMDHGCALVAERDGVIVGGFIGVAVEYFFSRERMASDLALFVEPNKRGGFIAAGLIRAFKAWAARQGVKHIEIGVSTGVHPEQTGALFEKLGLKRQGALYTGEL